VTLQAFLVPIAHEINQPLASMVTNADAGLRWLARDRPDLDEAGVALARIARGGHRAGRFIDGIRATFNKGGQEHARLDLKPLLHDVLERYRDECRAAHVAIHTEFAPALPPVSANRVQIEQVACNLVTNAIEAMRSAAGGQRVLRVRSAAVSGGEGLVGFEDSGTGLPALHEDRLFEPFFTTKPGRLGGGLTVSRLILEPHGGRLWAIGNVRAARSSGSRCPATRARTHWRRSRPDASSWMYGCRGKADSTASTSLSRPVSCSRSSSSPGMATCRCRSPR
jgi:C4-dicarboxylate-specific signal transduction histidine kinase